MLGGAVTCKLPLTSFIHTYPMHMATMLWQIYHQKNTPDLMQFMVSDLRPSIITLSTDIPQCLMQSIAMPQLAAFFDSFELTPYTLIPVYTRAVFRSGPVHMSVVWKVAYVNENLIIFT